VAIPPIQLHIKTTALQRAAKTASDKIEKESVKALKGIWKTLVKHQQKRRRPLVPLKTLRDCTKDCKNKIQEFFTHQKDWADQEAAMNPHRHSQQNTGRVQTKCCY